MVAPSISPPTLPPARINFDYGVANVTLVVKDAATPVPPNWLISAGSPPAGLVLDNTTGKLSGIVGAPCGTYNFTVTVGSQAAHAGTGVISGGGIPGPPPYGVNGTGTLFLTEVQPGDVLTGAFGTLTVQTVTDNVNISVAESVGVFTDEPFTITRPALVTQPFTIFVSRLPNGIDLIKRLPINDSTGCTLEMLNTIAQNALDIITSYTDIPFMVGTCDNKEIDDECLQLKTYSNKVSPDFWPVTEILSAVNGKTAMKVGTFKQLQLGECDIAITADGSEFRLRPVRPCNDGYNQIFVSYKAGMVQLPGDLYEVFMQLGLLIYKEKERVGIKSLQVGEGHTEYDRELPPHIANAMNHYRRSIYV